MRSNINSIKDMDINQIKLDNKFKLVEASAGTGKSFTLAHLVLRNVL